ncbi:MAG: hypothetical protein F4W95_11620 [Chloroflexi bacterium]|nr:hypothetical protein [Chloroflexota bacterium]MYD49115.1 hypothetical protein [Chloroflexota bacterium]
MREYRDRRRAAGLCIEGGCENRVRKYARCKNCRDSAAARAQDKRDELYTANQQIADLRERLDRAEREVGDLRDELAARRARPPLAALPVGSPESLPLTPGVLMDTWTRQPRTWGQPGQPYGFQAPGR